ncbi:hypothetical protein V6N13_103521 [Hibiscus sabdariffa]
MQNLNKSMEARLVKMDERMINWGGSTSIMDNMPKGTKIPRQEVSEQCEENPSMPRQHARAGVTSYMWAGIATSSNATTTSQEAAKSDASTISTESGAENDTITLMLKYEPIHCSHPQFSRQPHGIKETTCPGSKHTFCLGSEEIVCHGNEELACLGSTEATCLGSPEAARPGSRQATCPESICPGSKLTFCFSGEQNDCFNGNYLSDKITDCLENEAQSMVIPPTICAAPKSLLMEMFKKSEDNDTWKLDDFKNDVHSIDFHRILAKDCHNNWLEQQLPQQRRLHQTMMEVKALENYLSRAYFPAEGIFSRRGQKMEQQIKAILGVVLKQFQNYPPKADFSAHVAGSRFSADTTGMRFSPMASNQSPDEIPTEAGMDEKYKVECDWIGIFFQILLYREHVNPRWGSLSNPYPKPMRKEDDLKCKKNLLEVYFN